LGGYNVLRVARGGAKAKKTTRKKRMVKRGLNSARRNIIRTALASLTTGSCLRLSHALAAEKITPAEAAYQATPNGIYSCGMCSLFEPPSACKVVAGEVSQDGWCKVFALAD
jgi:hypothetical protein